MINISGFTLIELMITVIFLMVISSVSIPLIGTALRAREVDMAVRTVVGEISRARQLSVDKRRNIRMTIATPRNITTEQREGLIWTQVSQLDLPGDMEFRIEPEVTVGPAGYSILDENLARNPINLCGDNVYFLPNGSAIAVDGQICSGVIYLARADELETSRAVTIFGSTGKMKRWRYVTGAWESQ